MLKTGKLRLVEASDALLLQELPQPRPSPKRPVAKVTRPGYSHALHRDRLFRLLDDTDHAVVWVTAPPGAGKTTLASTYLEQCEMPHLWYQLDAGDADAATFFHYLGLAAENAARGAGPALPHLTAEYLAGLPVFARRYFEALAERFDPPFILVFDNYHDLAADAVLHRMLSEGFAALPPGFRVLVLSRTPPSAAFARLRASGQLALVGWDELRLTLEEVKSIEQLHPRKSGGNMSHQELHDKVQGWAAGLTLLLEQQGSAGAMPMAQWEPEVFFDYFAGEVFNQLDAPRKQVLLASAVLPRMRPDTLVQLCGQSTAGDLLADLHRKNYFTFKHTQNEVEYEFHPLFRAFLLNRARTDLAQSELQGLQKRAATLLVAAGQIDEAAALWRDAADWMALSDLIERHASAFIAQGRNQTLRDLIEALPPERLISAPWLLYWQGVCILPFDPESARAILERACEHFKSQGDQPASLFAICAIVDTFIFQWGNVQGLDRWIDELEVMLAEREAAFAAPLPAELDALVASTLFIALANRRPSHAHMGAWAERAWQISVEQPGSRLSLRTAPLLLLYLTWWLGDLGKAGVLLGILRGVMQQAAVPPLIRAAWCAMLSAYQWMSADNDSALATVAEGVRIGEQSGVHLWDVLALGQGVFASLSDDRLERAGKDLELVAARLTAGRHLDWATYYYHCACLSYAKGDVETSRGLIDAAVQKAEEAGAPFQLAILQNEQARVLFRQGESARAFELLDEVRTAGRNMGSATLEYLNGLVRAEANLKSGDSAAALISLREALAVGRAQNFQNHAWWSHSTMANLYAIALEHDIEGDYVCRIIRRRALAPPDGPQNKRWPWAVRLHMLGACAIEINQQPLKFEGKAQKKPLELLMAIVSLGGKDVAMTRVCDALWPDAEADAAQAAFNTALHRLRKLLGDDEAVTLGNSRISLNREKVWLDVWAFEQAFMQPEPHAHHAPAPSFPDADSQLENALHLYKGAFLDGQEESWALTLRERLRMQFLRQIAQASKRCRLRGNHLKAIDWLDKGIAAEPLAEALYFERMQCQEAMGQKAEALATYRQCRQILGAVLGIEPSAASQALHRELGATL